MDKRYQVFISSTSRDLQNARQEVSQALLRSDCFPAQMEQWPATDEEQFEFIKQIINQCDYYIVITAGMYGSIHPKTGLGYTEMEFDYALELGIPIIRLLHKDPLNMLEGSQIENSDAGKEKLNAFRQKLLDGKMCAFWETPAELGREVILSLNDIKKRKPMDGWVKASQMASSDAVIEIAELRRELSELKLLQNEKIRPTDIAAIIKSFDGSISLTRYDRDDAGDSVFQSLYGNKLIKYRFVDYIETAKTSEITTGVFLIKMLYGLLFNSDLQNAIQRAFASKETDESGYPDFLLHCPQTDSLEDILMTLETKGIIMAGEKFVETSYARPSSYATSYPWNLTPIGREWIIANKPK